MTQISESEYQLRMDRLKSLIDAADVELFLVTAPENIYYLTGIPFEPLERPFFLLVWQGGKSSELLVPKLEEHHLIAAKTVGSLHTYPEFPAPNGENWYDRLRSLIGTTKRIGVEPHLRRDLSDQLTDQPTVCLPLVEKLRLVKSPAEIAKIRRASRYADQAVRELLNASYRGATVAEGFARTGHVTREIIRDLDDWEPLTTKTIMATWAAPRSATPHSVPELVDRLDAGAHVALALTRINGYSAESERTYFTVPPTEVEKKAFRAMEEARRIAFERLRPGVSCNEIDTIVSEFLAREGYGNPDQRLHRTGHGIGLDHHEAPALAAGSCETLTPSMVVSVEPAIYLERHGGFRHSDTVRITEDGHEVLTQAPARLDELIIRGPRLQARLRGRIIRRMLQLDRKGVHSQTAELYGIASS